MPRLRCPAVAGRHVYPGRSPDPAVCPESCRAAGGCRTACSCEASPGDHQTTATAAARGSGREATVYSGS